MNRSVIYGFAASLGVIKGLQLLSKVLIAPGMSLPFPWEFQETDQVQFS